MTPAQTRALAVLGKAFAGCKAAGLAFYGVDGNINAIDAGLAPQGLVITERVDLSVHLVEVNTHGTYRDSGGW
jgi:hypothetical protein